MPIVLTNKTGLLFLFPSKKKIKEFKEMVHGILGPFMRGKTRHE